MVERRPGLHRGVASIASRMPRMRQAAYCASKAGMRQALRVLALETVPAWASASTSSRPGPPTSPMMRPLAADHPIDDLATGSPEAFRPASRTARGARPERDGAVAFLLWPDADTWRSTTCSWTAERSAWHVGSFRGGGGELRRSRGLTMDASLSTFAYDVVEEGADAMAANAADRRVGGVTMAVTYDEGPATMLPARADAPVRHLEPGVTFFRPDPRDTQASRSGLGRRRSWWKGRLQPPTR